MATDAGLITQILVRAGRADRFRTVASLSAHWREHRVAGNESLTAEID
jgi:hypothetical protein